MSVENKLRWSGSIIGSISLITAFVTGAFWATDFYDYSGTRPFRWRELNDIANDVAKKMGYGSTSILKSNPTSPGTQLKFELNPYNHLYHDVTGGHLSAGLSHWDFHPDSQSYSYKPFIEDKSKYLIAPNAASDPSKQKIIGTFNQQYQAQLNNKNIGYHHSLAKSMNVEKNVLIVTAFVFGVSLLCVVGACIAQKRTEHIKNQDLDAATKDLTTETTLNL